MKSTYKLNSVI